MKAHGILITGAGGVGKTTLSGAIAVAAARKGARTLVITVDPAKRLADALQLDRLGSDPTQNPDEAGLWAAMLDASTSWERIVQRHAPPEVAARLVVNEFFRAVADRFPASQAYAAAEEMANFLEAGQWDVVVVDTPPAGGGIDFFKAPADMRDLVGGRLLRWLTGARVPGRKTLYAIAGRPALRVADAVLGTDLLQRIADFLLDLRTTYDGLLRRARIIERHFQDSSIAVVTTADPAPVREAARFFRELPAVAVAPSVVIFNRTLPVSWEDTGIPPVSAGRTRQLLEANLRRWGSESHRQREVRDEFTARYQAATVTVPWLDRAPGSLDDLVALTGPELLGALGLG